MIRWAILGTGKIADALAQAINAAEESMVAAVGSRELDKAANFADRHDVPARYGSYLEACLDESVDVVYVATTNDLHYENTLAAVGNGKAVLCEKPFALNRRQAKEMLSAARAADVFLMEAMWTRFIPAIDGLLAMVREGALGEVRAVSADFGFVANLEPGSRLIEPRLGGGSLLDLGVYPISLAMMFMGEPIDVSASSHLDNGVDLQTAVALRFPEGRIATAFSSFLVDSSTEARVEGTTARARIHSRFHHSRQFDVIAPDQSVTEHRYPFPGSGYEFEVAEVNRCLISGEKESPRRPLADSLAVISVLDEIRRQVGIRFPQD
jgi:predicted dehydrogenase